MITLTREVMQMALDAFEAHAKQYPHMVKGYTVDAAQALRAALAQPEPEPVAVWELQEGGWDTIADRDWMESLPVGTKLYTAPPQREWQGLTDEEIRNEAKNHVFDESFFSGAVWARGQIMGRNNG